MTIDRLLERRLLFFGGKGGVGKTTLAVAVAQYAAERGERTLLISTDPAHSTGDMLEVSLDAEPTEVFPNLTVLEIDPTAEADRYIRDVKERIAASTPPRLVHEVERQIDIARLTPGAEESALFDRFTTLIEAEGNHYDRLIFDTAPLGHTLRLLGLPEHMHTWMNALIGRRRKVNALSRVWQRVAGTQDHVERRSDSVLEALEERRARFARVRTVLTDATRTAFVFVLIPERLPIIETEKAATALAAHGIPIGAVVINRIIPDSADGDFIGRRRQRERVYLERIERELGVYTLLRVSMQESDVVGREALHRLIAGLH